MTFNLLPADVSCTLSMHLIGHSRELEEHVNLSLLCSSLYHPVHHVHHPSGTLPARRALTTRLVLVEFGESGNGIDHICRLIHDDDCSCTQRSSIILERVVVHQTLFTCLSSDDGYGTSTWNDTLQVVPSTPDSSTMLLQ